MNATAETLGIQNIGQISIIVKDVERATAFYRDVLGLPLLFTVPNMAFFDWRRAADAGHGAVAGTRPSKSIFDFRVADIQAGHQRLMQHGVDIVAAPRLIAPMPTHDLWMTAFKDSEGNIHQLMSEVPRAAQGRP